MLLGRFLPSCGTLCIWSIQNIVQKEMFGYEFKKLAPVQSNISCALKGFCECGSQCEMMLHFNVVSHWLAACTKWSLAPISFTHTDKFMWTSHSKHLSYLRWLNKCPFVAVSLWFLSPLKTGLLLLMVHELNFAKIFAGIFHILMVQWGHNFAHVMTAELSWHWQTCDLIGSLVLT